MKRIALLLLMLGTPAAAGDVQVTDCRLTDSLRWVNCTVTNGLPVAFQKLRYEAQVTEPGRTYAWHPRETRYVLIVGGLEPGESMDLLFPIADLPLRAEGRELVPEISAVLPVGDDLQPLMLN